MGPLCSEQMFLCQFQLSGETHFQVFIPIYSGIRLIESRLIESPAIIRVINHVPLCVGGTIPKFNTNVLNSDIRITRLIESNGPRMIQLSGSHIQLSGYTISAIRAYPRSLKARSPTHAMIATTRRYDHHCGTS